MHDFLESEEKYLPMCAIPYEYKDLAIVIQKFSEL